MAAPATATVMAAASGSHAFWAGTAGVAAAGGGADHSTAAKERSANGFAQSSAELRSPTRSSRPGTPAPTPALLSPNSCPELWG